METIINEALKKGNTSISIKYNCISDSLNNEIIGVMFDGKEVKQIPEGSLNSFVRELTKTVAGLKEQYPNIHLNRRTTDFIFHHWGFTSSGSKEVPVEISNKPASSEVQKTGKVSLSLKMAGKNSILDLIKQHPDYELYLRTGFKFRGAEERAVDQTSIIPTLDWMCCADVEVIDNKIHVNAFSINDMM